jgi:hypothetical protein
MPTSIGVLTIACQQTVRIFKEPAIPSGRGFFVGVLAMVASTQVQLATTAFFSSDQSRRTSTRISRMISPGSGASACSRAIGIIMLTRRGWFWRGV